MIDKLLDRLAQTGTWRTLYHSFASLCALATIATWYRLASPSLTDSDAGDGRLMALGETPLAAIFRALAFLGISRDWVSTVGTYLAADADRAAALGTAAGVLGVLVTCTLSPTTSSVPSIQASTWWICAAVTVQCGGFSLLLLWLALWLLGKGARSHGVGEPLIDLVQLLSVPLSILALPLRLVLDRWTWREDRQN